jgi:DNA excision repair protein ERCC-2
MAGKDEGMEQAEQEMIKESMFPYDKLRNVQWALMQEVRRALEEKKDIIVHAPTGLGKTAATLSPALKYAMENKKKVFFLTSRHTQHLIAIETLKEIKKKHEQEVVAVDIIGKKWMCSVPGIDGLQSGEFYEYCKKQREDERCEFYNNTKQKSKVTVEAQKTLEQLKKEMPVHMERFREICSQDDLCAHEVAAILAKDASVIVADYYYIYNQWIRDPFFKKAGIDIGDCIVIVDEGHNLPDRIRNLMTVKLSNYMLKRAIKEAQKLEDEDLGARLMKLRDLLDEMSQEMKDGDERKVEKEEFVSAVGKICDYDEFTADLEKAAQSVREKEKQSAISGIADFLDLWPGADTGYARILSQKATKRESVVMLAYRCLDPSLFTNEVISNCHSTVIMSGTLTPTEMYKDVLGFPDDAVERRYKSPFPDENRLALVVPETTTKFSQRNPEMYERIATICAEITNMVPGNSALYFPSYYLRDKVYEYFMGSSTKTAFLENTDMSNDEKATFLENFKSYKETGAVLLGVVSGSFGEGIDLPGDLLKCVVVIGLPLTQPTLETKELIDYYEKKFGKGWDYGYVGPAFSKCLQSAGRCIRSETDRGVIVFLDERYVWQNYFKHFPRDVEIEVARDYKGKIEGFFSK